MTQAQFTMSIDAKLLYDKLSKLKIGDTFTYDQMSYLIKRDITLHRGVLKTARKALESEGVVFETIIKEGVVRVDDARKVKIAGTGMDKIRRVAKRSRKVLEAVEDFNALPLSDKVKHNALLSVYGVITEYSKPKQLNNIENSIANSGNRPLAIGETLKLMGST